MAVIDPDVVDRIADSLRTVGGAYEYVAEWFRHDNGAGVTRS